MSRFLARVVFYSAKKTAEESVVEWTARLQTLAEPCGFLQERDTVLRDIFAIGLGPGPLRDRLHHEIDADSSVSLVALQQLALEQETAAQRDNEGTGRCAVTIHNINVKKYEPISNKDQENYKAKSETTMIGAQVNINQVSKCPEKQNQNREPILPFNLRKQLSTFCGKEQEIEKLHESFETPGCHVVVVHGIFGSGKSVFVNKYAWEYRNYYNNNIIWIKYKDPKSFLQMFVALAKHLDLKYENWENPVPRMLVTAIYSHFNKKGKTLFVYDYVLSRNMLNYYLPDDIYNNIRVIITTPYSKWGSIKTIKLSPLNEHETISVFKAVTKETLTTSEQKDVIQRIPKTLQGMPGLVQRFSIYIAHECPRIDKKNSFAQCVDQLDINILYDKPFPKWSEQNNQKTIYTSLVATLENIQHLTENEHVSKMALKIINFCAYCNFDAPYLLLQKFCQNSSSNDSELLVAALSILVDLSLILYENENVHMNKLVRNLVLLHQQKCGTKSVCYSEVLEFILNTSDNFNLLEKCVFNFVEEQKETIFKVYKYSENQEKLKQLLTKYECQSIIDYIYNNENNSNQTTEHIKMQLSESSSDVCDFSIHNAAENGHLDIIKLLVSHNKSLIYLAKNNLYKSLPIHRAAVFGHIHILKYFLHDHQVPIEITNGAGNTVLHLAALNGELAAASFLIDEGADINARNKDGGSVLHAACAGPSVPLVKFLLEKGISINVRDDIGVTPMLTAAANGRTDAVCFLLDKGVDVNEVNSTNCNALHYSVWDGHVTTTKMLIEKGCCLRAENNDGNTPLMDAISRGHLSVVKVFCENGCRPDDPSSKDGRTPMSVACSKGCKQICEYFLKQFPDLYNRSDILPAKKRKLDEIL